ncbi:hypothetical protein BU16DRAFT_554199 [Lophium mytilinum]|uniref:Uncharacterized protein n=1 Tax=Lophium mytilinum TaxID=390894 RepID=A0A6A6RCM3_9PEZI|nr:hypothetical protein BU16DRAFT_554199 [Lophium mytilinum]
MHYEETAQPAGHPSYPSSRTSSRRLQTSDVSTQLPKGGNFYRARVTRIHHHKVRQAPSWQQIDHLDVPLNLTSTAAASTAANGRASCSQVSKPPSASSSIDTDETLCRHTFAHPTSSNISGTPAASGPKPKNVHYCMDFIAPMNTAADGCESSLSIEPEVSGDDDLHVSNTGREGSSAVPNHDTLAVKLTGLCRDSVQSLKPLRLGHTDAVPYVPTGTHYP